MSNQNQNSISWQAWEFKHYPKSSGWYIALVSVFILIMAFFVIVESDIFAAVSMGLICALIIVFSRHVPERVNIELSPRGVHFGNLFYPYKQIKHFWVVHNERHQSVNFQTSALVNSLLIIQLDEQDPELVRQFLLQYLPEHTQVHESPTQSLMHRFKF